jgi:hypothetical protein
VLGTGLFYGTIPVMAVAGLRAERALLELGGETRPRISRAAVLLSSVGLGTIALGATLAGTGLVPDQAAYSGVFVSTLSGASIVIATLPFAIAQIEHLHRHNPAGSSQGTRAHRLLVTPYASRDQAGLSLSARF